MLAAKPFRPPHKKQHTQLSESATGTCFDALYVLDYFEHNMSAIDITSTPFGYWRVMKLY